MAPAKTASTCTTETAQGSHVFSICGYSQKRGMGVGKFVRSGTFSVGSHDWAIRFYPDGPQGSQEDYIFVYLDLLSRGATVHASSDLRLIDQTTGLPSSVTKIAPTVLSCYDSLDFTEMACWYQKRTEFEASAYLRGDRLDIECVVTVMNEPRVSQTKYSPKVAVPPSDIMVHLGKLLELKEAADVTFYVGEDTFAAHKIVLAMRSPVFKAELFGPMREAGAQVIPIKDMQPGVFKALLHFIYTDWLPTIDDLVGDDRGEMIRHLLVAADRYAMERLKLICESDLCENLDVQTVAATLALADQHHCASLKDACIEFMSSSSMDDIVATQGFVDLKTNCPSALVDAFVKMSMLNKR